ncbi:glutathione S-transferase 1-like [Dermacentor andersoni]|uniref:glutathione S-transferase 1-like n=1 Tax=Dermacentor andersoni TaxID=34620 RepID=UPI002417E4B5|nr:glutathione S-transferase 1-like [Dermacentor andersoni]
MQKECQLSTKLWEIQKNVQKSRNFSDIRAQVRRQMWCSCCSSSTAHKAQSKVHPLKQDKLGAPVGFANNPVPMELYHMDASPPCRAVRMVARHLNLSLNLIPVNFMAGEHMTPQFRKINPQSVLPTLVDDGFVLWESRAVLTYLVNRYVPHSPLYPTDPRSRASVERLLYFDMGTLFDACHKILYPVIFGGPLPDSEQEKPLVRALDLLGGFLGENKFLSGDDVTLADISILATLTVTEASLCI